MIYIIAISVFVVMCLLLSSNKNTTPVTNVQQQPQRPTLTDVEQEAIRQADEAFDWQTHNAIVNGTYAGSLPDYDGAYWSRIYPDLLKPII